MARPIRRRDFLTELGLGAAGMAAGLTLVEPRTARAAPSDQVVIGIIGCGIRGRRLVEFFGRAPDARIAALCDVDPSQIDKAMAGLEKTRSAAGAKGGPVEQYKDFRKVLERKDLDAIAIATPDHWHAYMTTAACAAGKDVYAEKPVAHSIVEGRAMVKAARRHKRIVQVGTQQRSGKHFQSAVELVRSGALGKVHVCRTWIARNLAPEGMGNPPDSEPPAGVDYDMWLGPAPKRPFNRNRFHLSFRWFWDYANGTTTDWGVHLNDIILWAMDRIGPRSVQAVGGRLVLKDNTETPDTLEVLYDYGDFLHIYTVRRACQGGAIDGTEHGMQFEGSGGVLTLKRTGWVLKPEVVKGKPRGEARTSEGSEQDYPHVQNFLECIKTRKLPTSDLEGGHRATVTGLLAMIAYKVGRRIHWDAEKEICVREDGKPDTAANGYLFREPRAPWKLEI